MDRVVVDGTDRLSEGTQVRVRKAGELDNPGSEGGGGGRTRPRPQREMAAVHRRQEVTIPPELQARVQARAWITKRGLKALAAEVGTEVEAGLAVTTARLIMAVMAPIIDTDTMEARSESLPNIHSEARCDCADDARRRARRRRRFPAVTCLSFAAG